MFFRFKILTIITPISTSGNLFADFSAIFTLCVLLLKLVWIVLNFNLV